MSDRDTEIPEPLAEDLAIRHLRFGWVALAAFVTLGLVLDSLHALKLGWYLDVGNETRRLMWTLSHAHGVGLGLLHLGYGATLKALWEETRPPLELASACLMWSTGLMPISCRQKPDWLLTKIS